MRAFTLKDEVTTGLRFQAQSFDDPGWSFCLGMYTVKASSEIIEYLYELSHDLESPHRNIFSGYLEEAIVAARTEVKECGWAVDDLAYIDDALYPTGKPHPKGGACLLHVATPQTGLCASSYDELLAHGHVKRQYHDITDAVGITPLRTAESKTGSFEHLFQMEQGSSFRIKRQTRSSWTEALILWTGWELKLLQTQRRRSREYQHT